MTDPFQTGRCEVIDASCANHAANFVGTLTCRGRYVCWTKSASFLAG